MKVLIATDFSECSSIALNRVLKEQWPEDVEFCLVNVIQPIDVAAVDLSGAYVQPMVEFHSKSIERRRELLDKQVVEIKKVFPDSVVSCCVLEGSPAAAIIEKANTWQADQIVLGSHGLTRAPRFLIGSVAESVTRGAHCSVYVIRGSSAASALPKDSMNVT